MNRNMKFDTLRASHVSMRRPMTLLALAAIAAASMVLARAATPATINGIILLVGANESQRVVSWYASANTGQVVQVAPTSQVQDGAFPSSASTYPAVLAANTVNGGFNGHAILDNLDEHTAYSYRVGGDGAWSATFAFKTRKFDGNFDFLFFGDPQIGSSGNVPKDQAGWADTLQVALAANPEAELLVSGGDQVETAGVETQWTAFLAPDGLRAVPWVATIGNHDVGGRAYEQHLWTPNTDRSASLYRSGSLATQSGGDYWFIYKDVLFIDLNSNAYATTARLESTPTRRTSASSPTSLRSTAARPSTPCSSTTTRSTRRPTTRTTPTTRSAVRTSRRRSLDSVWTSSSRVTTTATRAAT